MNRHPALQPLSRMHHQLLIVGQGVQIDTPSFKNLPATVNKQKNYVLQFYHQTLLPHIKKEEAVLFPFIQERAPELQQLSATLQKEHRQLRQYIDLFNTPSFTQQLLDQWGKQLVQHIRKEERQLFQKIQVKCTERELRQLGEKLS